MKITLVVFKLTFFSLFAVGLLSAKVFADELPIGYISWDVTIPGSAGEFDIANQTGPNSSGDATFPVSTTVNLSSLSLTVDFTDGSTQTYGSSYFSLDLDGLSFDGTTIPIGGTNPLPIEATLTGIFSPTSLTLFDGSTPSISPTFSAELSDTPNLVDGDLAVIYAGTSGPAAPVPEPGTWLLMGIGIMGLVFFRHKHSVALSRKCQ
jgi:hypothetical protein